MDNPLFKFNDKADKLVVNGKDIPIIGTYDEPWLAGKELCEALGYKDPKYTLQNNVREKHKKSLSELHNGSTKYHEGTVYVSEQGAYALAMNCELPCGDVFREWIFNDVRPLARIISSK